MIILDPNMIVGLPFSLQIFTVSIILNSLYILKETGPYSYRIILKMEAGSSSEKAVSVHTVHCFISTNI